jgi:hypothetical protein
MAKLGTFFGPHTGTLKIYLDSFKVGSGSFPAFEDFKAVFSGTYSVLGQSGNLMLAINLTDNNPTSTSGPCSLTLNGNTDANATYNVNGQKLTVTTALNENPVDVYTSEGGTQIDNISGHNAWFGP